MRWLLPAGSQMLRTNAWLSAKNIFVNEFVAVWFTTVQSGAYPTVFAPKTKINALKVFIVIVYLVDIDSDLPQQVYLLKLVEIQVTETLFGTN